MSNGPGRRVIGCAVCAFSPPEVDAPSSYALVVSSRYKRTHTAWSAADASSRNAVVLNKSAYCDACKRVTWLSQDTDVQDALVRWYTCSHEAEIAFVGSCV